MNIDAQIKFIEAIIDDHRRRLVWLEAHRSKIEALGLGGLFATGKYDFDHLTHDKIVRVMLAFPGKWSKTPNSSEEATIDYECEFDGIIIRCWAGQPPPNCRIIEVDEEVPPQPATTRKVRKIICKEAADPIPAESTAMVAGKV